MMHCRYEEEVFIDAEGNKIEFNIEDPEEESNERPKALAHAAELERRSAAEAAAVDASEVARGTCPSASSSQVTSSKCHRVAAICESSD